MQTLRTQAVGLNTLSLLASGGGFFLKIQPLSAPNFVALRRLGSDRQHAEFIYEAKVSLALRNFVEEEL